ncbi:MAG: PqqD family protein [Nevskia sp.]|nr:PqqD family protein [Nevskia sp.]
MSIEAAITRLTHRQRYWAVAGVGPTQVELIDELVEHYNGDRERIERDVAALRVRLAGEGQIDAQASARRPLVAAPTNASPASVRVAAASTNGVRS